MLSPVQGQQRPFPEQSCARSNGCTPTPDKHRLPEAPACVLGPCWPQEAASHHCRAGAGADLLVLPCMPSSCLSTLRIALPLCSFARNPVVSASVFHWVAGSCCMTTRRAPRRSWCASSAALSRTPRRPGAPGLARRPARNGACCSAPTAHMSAASLWTGQPPSRYGPSSSLCWHLVHGRPAQHRPNMACQD